MNKQSQWKSSTGFILASAGSAIGLGAMWKFPYMAGIYGGGAFLLMFLVFTIFVGLPLLMMEFTVGKMGKTYTTKIYEKLTKKKIVLYACKHTYIYKYQIKFEYGKYEVPLSFIFYI